MSAHQNERPAPSLPRLGAARVEQTCCLLNEELRFRIPSLMLTSETKDQISAARNVLVDKVLLPTDQVWSIMLASIPTSAALDRAERERFGGR